MTTGDSKKTERLREEKQKKRFAAGTPYDDAFRTMTNDCPDLLIPVINEIFGTNYSIDAKVIFGQNEHFINTMDGDLEKRITDSSFTIVERAGKASGKYLIECQSKPDSTMVVRIFEYATQIALDENVIIGNRMTVEIPCAAILFLRSNTNTPDKLEIEIITPGGTVSFDIPSMKLASYNLGSIFEKELYFLIPFFLFNREKTFAECETDQAKLKRLLEEVSRLIHRLDHAMEEDHLSAYQRCIILDMAKLVLEALTVKYRKVKEGVEKIMRGRVIETEASRIYREGAKEADQKRLKQVARAMLDDGLEPERVARILHLTVEKLEELVGLATN
jgi:hypothetical protein